MTPVTFKLVEVCVWILAAGLAGCVIGLFSYFLDYCFWPKSIFGRYLPWLAKRVLKSRNDWEGIKALPDDQLVDLAGDHPRFKLFGGCAVCFNVHHTWVAFLIVWLSVPQVPLWAYLPFMTASSLVIRKLVGAD